MKEDGRHKAYRIVLDFLETLLRLSELMQVFTWLKKVRIFLFGSHELKL